MKLLPRIALLITALPTFSCSSADELDPVSPPDPTAVEAALALIGVPCSDTLEDIYAAAVPPASFADTQRGTIIRCAYDRFVTPDEMRAHFTELGDPDPGISTGVHKIRLAYWTTRGPGEPMLTTAALYLPDEPVAKPSPLLVLGHGSVGIGDACAPSREDPAGFLKDARSQVFTLAGDGWISIMPDNAGLGTAGANAWGYAIDEGHAMLDATRAARKLLKPGLLDSKNVLVGHSIGGHAALSASSYIDSYGVEGTVEASVVYVPLWFSNATWGALLSNVGASSLTPTLLSLAMQYFYGHLAVYEGEDHALDAFIDDKKQAAGEFLEGGCWRQITGATNGPNRIGISKASDAFTPTYTTDVGVCAVTGTCTTPGAAAWKERWTTDRPQPVKSIPIVLWQGAKDDFITPGFQQCGIDRLKAQGVDLTVCVDPEGDHSNLIAHSATWVRSYLREKLFGEAAPAPCAALESLGSDLQCSVPIANSSDPKEP